ncbi:MAG TPA: hypothetical protein VN633_03675, partial [Bryobacteraceae bacterium]|nr:hypothetical protein [Bryobacteraceae bacterium]
MRLIGNYAVGMGAKEIRFHLKDTIFPARLLIGVVNKKNVHVRRLRAGVNSNTLSLACNLIDWLG